jgi:hypothetical protein
MSGWLRRIDALPSTFEGGNASIVSSINSPPSLNQRKIGRSNMNDDLVPKLTPLLQNEGLNVIEMDHAMQCQGRN